MYLCKKNHAFNLLKMAGRFIDQKYKEQGMIISIRISYKEVTLMEVWVKYTHWLLLKRETIPTKQLIKRKKFIGIFLTLHASNSQKGAVLKRLSDSNPYVSEFRRKPRKTRNGQVDMLQELNRAPSVYKFWVKNCSLTRGFQ